MSTGTAASGCPMKGIADYSLLDAETLASPWEFYAKLHAEQPV